MERTEHDVPKGYAVTHPDYGCAYYVEGEDRAQRLASMITDSTVFAFEALPDWLSEALDSSMRDM